MSGGRRLAGWLADGFVWLVVVVETLVMVKAGLGKFESYEGWMHWFEVFGYPRWFSPVVGGLELVGGLLLLIPALSSYAALMLAVIMAGALHAVTTHTTDLSAFDPILGLVLLAIIAAARWRRRWRPGLGGDAPAGKGPPSAAAPTG